MHFGNIKFIDSVDGEGVRVSLFVSGCKNHCKGCFSEVTWDFNYGKEFTEIEENEILEALNKPYISGLTILGGDPMEEENQPVVLNLIRKVKEKFADSKNIWLYSGYIFEKDLIKGKRKHIDGITDEILKNVDVLVDGPFILEKRNITLKFRGSENQRLLKKEDRDILLSAKQE